MMNFKGLFVAVTTPFCGGQPDVDSLRRHLELLRPHASGFVFGGTTGEGASLSDDEIGILLKEARATANGKTVIAGFWRPNCETSLKAARRLSHLADALLVPLPRELFHEDEGLIEQFYLDLDQTVRIPILLYNFPARCEGREISLELAEKIATSARNIVGVKDSSSDVQLAKNIVSRRLALQPILGNDRFLFDVHLLAEQHGAPVSVASISGASSVPEIARTEARIYKLMGERKHAEARSLQERLIGELFDHWSSHSARLGGEAPILKSLIQLGLETYPVSVRPPLQELGKHDRATVTKLYTDFIGR